MFDIISALLIGRRFKDRSGKEWITVGLVNEAFVLAVGPDDPLPAQVYLVKEPEMAAAAEKLKKAKKKKQEQKGNA